MADGIEDYLRLGNDSTLTIEGDHIRVLRDALVAITEFGPMRKKKMSRSKFANLLENLRPIDTLWELAPDEITIAGSTLDRPEIIRLVAWLRSVKGGFTLNAPGY